MTNVTFAACAGGATASGPKTSSEATTTKVIERETCMGPTAGRSSRGKTLRPRGRRPLTNLYTGRSLAGPAATHGGGGGRILLRGASLDPLLRGHHVDRPAVLLQLRAGALGQGAGRPGQGGGGPEACQARVVLVPVVGARDRARRLALLLLPLDPRRVPGPRGAGLVVLLAPRYVHAAERLGRDLAASEEGHRSDGGRPRRETGAAGDGGVGEACADRIAVQPRDVRAPPLLNGGGAPPRPCLGGAA